MTATLIPVAEQVDAAPVTTTLSLAHDRWIERIARFLAPTLQARATFWERWGAVRYLADEFQARFRLEQDLVESLAGLLPASIRRRLAAGGAAVARTRDQLMAAGRRRGTAPEVRLLARRLLDQTRRWCATVELATSRLHQDDLTPETRELLERLDRAAGPVP